MEKKNLKAWLYLLPAILFLGIFMVYPLIDVFIYSFEEGFNSSSQTYSGIGIYNYSYILRDPYFLQALKNTFILVMITVPVSTGLALLISVGLSSIKWLKNLFQTVYFLPYVTNTLAVGLVFGLRYFNLNLAIAICVPILLLLVYGIVNIKRAVICCVRIYQRYAPETVRRKCRFEPSCSEYMILAIEKYGFFKGVAKGINRLKRCNINDGGYDMP